MFSLVTTQVIPLKLAYLRNNSTTGLATYFCAYIQKEIEKLLAENRIEDDTPYNLLTDELKIITTLYSSMQAYAKEAVQEQLAIF